MISIYELSKHRTDPSSEMFPGESQDSHKDLRIRLITRAQGQKIFCNTWVAKMSWKNCLLYVPGYIHQKSYYHHCTDIATLCDRKLLQKIVNLKQPSPHTLFTVSSQDTFLSAEWVCFMFATWMGTGTCKCKIQEKLYFCYLLDMLSLCREEEVCASYYLTVEWH